MNLRYSTRKLEKTVETFSAIKKHYGIWGKQISQRLADLTSAKNLADMYTIRPAHCHELKADRATEFAVSISRNHRIIFIPDHDPIPRKEDGGVDVNQVNSVIITAIGEDYH